MTDSFSKHPEYLPNSRAFTLIELLVVLLVIAILLALAVPVSQEFIVENRSIRETNVFITGLYNARSSAIQLGDKVVFCKSSDHKSCGGDSWDQGQIIMDENKHQVLKVLPALDKHEHLIWNSSAGKDDKVEWLASGYTNGQRGTFYYCADRAYASYSREIVLLDTGRLYVTLMSAADYTKFCP